MLCIDLFSSFFEPTSYVDDVTSVLVHLKVLPCKYKHIHLNNVPLISCFY